MNELVSWGLFLLVNGLAIKSSYSAAAFLNRSDRSFALSALTTGVIYLATITATLIVLGTIFHAMDRTTVAAVSAAISVIMIVVFRRKRRPFYSEIAHAWTVLRRESDLFLYVLFAIFVLQAIVLIVKVVLLPPHIWDVFYYHLTPAVEWFQRGQIPLTLDVPAENMNRVPLGGAVLSYWFFIFFGDDFLVNLPQTLWAFLLVPVVYLFGRLGGVGRAWAIKFAILAFFIPFVLMQAITCKDHLALTASFLAGLIMLCLYLRSQDSRMLVSAGIAFGLMLGYKKAAPAFLAVALVLFLIVLWINRKRVFAHGRRLQGLAVAAVIGLVSTFLTSGFWYYRGLLSGHAGGAILPPQQGVASDAASAAAAAGAHAQGRFSLDALVYNVKAFFGRALDIHGAYTADLIGVSGFGPQFTAFGLIALLAAVILLFRRREYRRPELLMVLTALALFVAFLFANYNANANSYRILVFLPVLMIGYAGILLWRLRFLQDRLAGAVVNVAMLVCVVWSMVAVLPPPQTNPMQFKAYLTAPKSYQSSGTYTAWFSMLRPDFYRVLAAMPVEEPVGIVSPPLFNKLFRKGQYETWSYPYYDRNWRRHLVYFKDRDVLDCNPANLMCKPTPALKDKLAAKGIHLVSTCPTNRCVELADPDFYELAPGFYYFRGVQQ
ncbi:MAG: hypothetical protein GC138_06235 [Gammaproteobacteria bacterium]|nr:hypothetical protein [Gammaproteobacteria bacterium]